MLLLAGMMGAMVLGAAFVGFDALFADEQPDTPGDDTEIEKDLDLILGTDGNDTIDGSIAEGKGLTLLRLGHEQRVVGAARGISARAAHRAAATL